MKERCSDDLDEPKLLPWLVGTFIATPVFLIGILMAQSEKVNREREQEPPTYLAGIVKDETYSKETNTRMFSVESNQGLKIFEYEDSPLAQKLDTSMSRGDRVRVEVRSWQERLPNQPNHYYINPHQVQDINGKTPSL